MRDEAAGSGAGSPSPGITSFGGDFDLTMKPSGSAPVVDIPFKAHVDCTTS